ncbi:hypothetical protein FOE78_12750 [Microlunatus elymi]|uniref:Uncharacterized protein n=1 Tax=Microlunatus elymi TaxID=2596828 RepID=A0A516PZR6_9ACTN|nr:hypothetical protein [Microlunatus elymi]QDP96664.1 hypothetical protein FOE78_12750 [Microlunatus elymi]
MSILAVLLIAIGVSDLFRRPPFPPWLPLPAGPAMVLLVGLLAGLGTPAEVGLLVLVALICLAWTVLVGRSRTFGSGRRWPLIVMLGGAGLVIGLSGLAGPAGGWLADWLRALPWSGLAGLEPDRFLLLVGLFLIQLSTGNELVRLVLGGVGAIKPAGQPQAADQLRGGRLLGPLERIFILGLGLTGQVTAAGLVIAAKGLIRFPELSARRSDATRINGIGIDEVTEYFLLGSFVSWLISLAALGIAYLG